jgi:general L-amino acid transport system substrate-binding protein
VLPCSHTNRFISLSFQCRGIAAMVLGDPEKIETIITSNAERFLALANGTVDIITRTTTHTMSRDVSEVRSNVGFTFTVPFLYDGVRFGGDPWFVHCADQRIVTGNCSDLNICVNPGTTDFDVLESLVPSANLEPIASDRLFDAFFEGECNVLSGEQNKISEVAIRSAGYTGAYRVGSNVFSKEPLTMATGHGDSKWSNFANTVLQALFAAEELGITKKNANDLMNSDASFDTSSFESQLLRVVAAIGNYAEVYDRHLKMIFPRSGLNFLNNGTTGLIYSHPFGNIDNVGSGPVPGGMLEKILKRGNLICGVRPQRPGFAVLDYVGEWSGLDTDYCRALSSALFGSVWDTVEFLEVIHDEGSFLANNSDVDVIAGACQKFELGNLSSFSQPYFYTHGNSSEAALSLMTPSDDVQWSAFVYWVVSATFHAEEETISRFNSNQMPEVNLFGPSFMRMFRDVILSVGNYGEIYFRNVESIEPRSGRNLLNGNPFGPQHHNILQAHFDI